ncbi:MAG: hypothetical protein HFF36_05035 [Coprobacillus sp.]|nr:hypothetical protein [Coprobacillus sp.]
MENINREPLIHSGAKVFRPSDIWLEELTKTQIIQNPNYITVLNRIPEYFDTNDLSTCMMLAFNFGEQRGRECERDLIKWNVSACFYNIKVYAHEHNGQLPKTLNDLKDWEEEVKKGVGL